MLAFLCLALPCVPPRSPWVLPTSRTLTSFFFSCLSCSPSLRFLLPSRLEWSRMGSFWPGRVVGRGEMENRSRKRWRGAWDLPPAHSLPWLLLLAVSVFVCLSPSTCLACFLLLEVQVSYCLRWVSPSAWYGCYLLVGGKSVARSSPKSECYIKKP